jgi:DNA excision repair protein ERCC-2
VLSEGVDYPGDTIIGAFIVGPPLPAWNIEQQGRREFFEKRFGQGMHHASTWPAMAKAVQAAGRVIRTETDRGLIVLFDDRFLEKDYATAMPRGWFKSSPRELISQSILSEVEQFWSGSARP